MRRFRRGFTMIEVSLFLAITGLLFIGITVGVQNSIYQQRYNDTVQNFMEFLRGVYSEVTNVQSSTNGNSNKAFYGKLISFGEKYDLDGNSNKEKIFVYDVIGDADGSLSSGSISSSLNDVGATLDTGTGRAYSYSPRWSSTIEDKSGKIYEGGLLIVRHPRSGTVYTVRKNSGLGINEAIKKGTFNKLRATLWNGFTHGAVDYCVNPNGDSNGLRRIEVQIKDEARNSSGIVMRTGSDNECAVETHVGSNYYYDNNDNDGPEGGRR